MYLIIQKKMKLIKVYMMNILQITKMFKIKIKMINKYFKFMKI